MWGQAGLCCPEGSSSQELLVSEAGPGSCPRLIPSEALALPSDTACSSCCQNWLPGTWLHSPPTGWKPFCHVWVGLACGACSASPAASIVKALATGNIPQCLAHGDVPYINPFVCVRDKISPCRPDWSAVARSAALTSWAQVILLSQPPE
uniref:Uncharacterized protein n=1 Tax=Macaca fascicularis TaxID=9541 RepID=A0A7N9CBW1_MACFA